LKIRILQIIKQTLYATHLGGIKQETAQILYFLPHLGDFLMVRGFYPSPRLQLLRKLNVLHIKLQIGLALPGVVFQVIADAKGIAGVDAVEEIVIQSYRKQCRG